MRSFRCMNRNFTPLVRKAGRPAVQKSWSALGATRNFSAESHLSGQEANDFLSHLGIKNPSTIHRNLDYSSLAEHEEKNKEGTFVDTKYGNVFTVDTGKFTGRSPGDKFLVRHPESESDKNLWWGKVNQVTSPEVFDELYTKCIDHYNTLDRAYVFDGYAGANASTRRNVRFVTEYAWQSHFVTNMFIRPQEQEELDGFKPAFTIINACNVTNVDFEKHGLNSEVFTLFDPERNVAIIGGTFYGGEMKKGIFSMMNYWLPMEGILSMHCSANIGPDGDTALFFGLSGTGKTTLSADPERKLIGDDEHGWDADGIFNFEGGCYAKTINLLEENEPEIFRAIKRDAMLENVHINEDLTPDYANVEKTQNGRVSYPLYHIDNFKEDAKGNHPNNVIFLTADAFGVLPPVSRLSKEQAMYHFLSGYTAKVAGTERGVTEPQATFSACFGAAFLTLHPQRYAELLGDKLDEHNSKAFLVNTGWTGGAYGVGERISIKNTRACIDAILNGTVNDAEFTKDPIFGFEVPTSLPGVDAGVCDPRSAWSDKAAYDAQREKLNAMFEENYKQFL